MKEKNLLLIRTWLYALLAVFFLSTPLWLKVDEGGLGYPFAYLMAAVLAYFAYRCFKQIKTTKNEEMAYAPPANATTKQQITFYKRYMLIGLAAYTILTIIIVPDLNDLESHSVDSVHLWAPVSFLYKQFGYWPAVLFVPVLGLIITLLFLRKIKQVKALNE
ncbi:MAG TPA: hypothetical protein VK835_03915 [Bacteroidia bacterium]|nr:hypothetical protein [Bacteroidia bacterium]